MTERWHPTAALAGLPGMPKGPRPIRLHGRRRGLVARSVKRGGRTILEWLESSLPPETQDALRHQGSGGRSGSPVEGKPACGSPAPGSRDTTAPASLATAGRAEIADARLEIVAAFEAWRSSPGAGGLALVAALKRWVAAYAEAGTPEARAVSAEARAIVPAVAWNTLQRWRTAWRARGVAGLLPSGGGRGRKSAVDRDLDFAEEAEAQLFARWPHVTARQIRRGLEARYPDREPPSIHSLRRWIRRWVEDNAGALSAVSDPDGHRSKRTPAFGDAAAGIDALNALWELDSTVADVMCSDGRRHALVAAIDVWSRRARVVVTPRSRATAIAALLRRCLLDWGVPETIRTDRGADYVSRHVSRAILDLQIEHAPVPPFRPEKKPFIERFIKTLSHDLFCQLPGFAGHNVAEAQRLRERKSYAARKGEAAVVTFKCALTPEQLQQKIDAWCDHIYAREPHAGLAGQSPFERAASWAGQRRRVADERALDVLLAEPASQGGTRTVTNRGLAIDGGQYIAAELGGLVGQRVQVRLDPADYGRVFVFARDGAERNAWRFACLAEDPLRTGIDRAGVAARAKALAAQDAGAARSRARTLDRERRPAAVIDDVLAHAAAKAGRVVAFPALHAPGAEPHRTPGLDAAAAARDAADAAPPAGVEPAPKRKRAAAAARAIFLEEV